MAKQKFRPTRRSGFSGVKAYIMYVEVLKNRCNTVGRTFCDAILCTFRISTGMANAATSFMLNRTTTIRAGSTVISE